MQRKDNNKRNIEDVENNNGSTHKTTPNVKKINNNSSPILETLGGANACG